MNKNKSLLTILILLILVIILLDTLWIQNLKVKEPKDIKEKSQIAKLTMTEKNIEKNKVRFIDMTVHKNHIEPTNIHVNQGDTVIIAFADNNATLFDFKYADINYQTVKSYNFKFTADKKGVYEYYCLTCSDKTPGVFIIS